MSLKYFDTKQLEAFSAVVSIGSMTGAARAIGRSQPVITRLIQDLEAEVGFALLHRSGPRISPTAQGLAFYEQVEVFLSGLRAIADKAEAIETAAPLPMQIAAVPALASSLLPSTLAGISPALLPQKVHIQSISAENVVQAVVARTADLGLASWPLDNPGVEIHWQAEVACKAVVAVDHPLAGRPVITPAELKGQRLIVAANPYRLRMQIEEALAANDVVANSVIDCNATYVSLSLARQKLGIAIVEPLTVMGLPLQGVRTVPLSFDIPFRWSVITAVGRPLSASVETIIHHMRDTAVSDIEGLTLSFSQN
ncbi:LysR family transcriptional regulator [Devosia geojensis]|uniref:LysR family transcriptional regulator n=1 Tax=Devosia geojensis TaxID=443610 RepID=A0A0F5FTJ2_9HYPH|nr:LysR family transcriptional regulator [Devosia geojensis]KKB12179.1 LysR family transcriptional regulator [Devosia geojensis]